MENRIGDCFIPKVAKDPSSSTQGGDAGGDETRNPLRKEYYEDPNLVYRHALQGRFNPGAALKVQQDICWNKRIKEEPEYAGTKSEKNSIILVGYKQTDPKGTSFQFGTEWSPGLWIPESEAGEDGSKCTYASGFPPRGSSMSLKHFLDHLFDDTTTGTLPQQKAAPTIVEVCGVDTSV